jgi:hypothetical protein
MPEENHIPHLTEAEVSSIRTTLAQLATRRRTISPDVLRVIVDRTQVSDLDLRRTSGLTFQIADGSELIEVWGREGTVECLLATFLVRYSQDGGISTANASIVLEGGQKLRFKVSPTRGSTDERPGATVTFDYCRPSKLTWFWLAINSFVCSHANVPQPVLLAIGLAGILLVWGSSTEVRKVRLLRQQETHLTAELFHERAARSALDAELERTRGLVNQSVTLRPANVLLGIPSPRGLPSIAGEPISVMIPVETAITNFQLLVGEDKHTSYRAILRLFRTNRELLTQSFLAARRTHAGRIVTWPVASSVLIADQVYLVSLEGMTTSGRFEEVDYFAFRAVKK